MAPTDSRAVSTAPDARPGWDDLQAFLAVAVHGSMSRAGAALGESQPTIGRRIRRLEQALGVVLLERGPNTVALTAAGRDLLRAAGPMAAAAREIDAAMLPHRPRTDRPLKVTATASLSMFLSEHLAVLATPVAPRGVILLPSRRPFDLARGEADIALRMRAPPKDPDLLVRRAGRLMFAAYAAGDDPALPMIVPGNGDSVSRQRACAELVLRHRPAGPQIDELYLRLQAVRSGVGAGMLPCWIGDRDPALRRVHVDIGAVMFDEIFLVRAARSKGDPAVDRLAVALAALLRRHRAELAGEAQPSGGRA